MTPETRVRLMAKLGWDAKLGTRTYRFTDESPPFRLVQFMVQVGDLIYQCDRHVAAGYLPYNFADLQDWLDYTQAECIENTKRIIFDRTGIDIEVDHAGGSA